ncbi:MAG: hypothetical protein ACYTKD_03510 [Planctomycetota bacterium]|jgi:hypothetical protein
MEMTSRPCPLCGGDARIEGLKLSPSVRDDWDYVLVRGQTCRPLGYFLTIAAYKHLAGPGAACSERVCNSLSLRIQEDPVFGSLERPITVDDCQEAEKAA